MDRKIGVYVCECGPNIADALDIDRVIEAVSGMENVAVVERYKLMCSPDGKKYLAEQIKEHGLTHLVVGACSPKQHEATFMAVCEEGGMNPFLMQMANLREQIAWITPDKEKATERAIRHMKAAIRRVRYHAPLEKKEIECNPDVLVIGGGIAGMSAALLLSSPDRKVFLVEKNEELGGMVSRCEKLFPDMVKFFGNFVVTVREKESEPREFKVGAVVVATGADLFDPGALAEYGYGKIKNVVTASELEEMNLKGKIALEDGKEPKSVGIIHCVGRKEKGYCSEVCCRVGIKISRYLKEKIPGASVTQFYQDLCIPGSVAQAFYEETRNAGVEFVCTEAVKLSESDKKIQIDHDGKLATVDMVVLLPAIEAAESTSEISEMLGVKKGKGEFLTEEHEKIGPVTTTVEGVFLAGTVSGPKTVRDTVSQSEAAAGKILSSLVPGRKLETEARTSKISESLCTGCRTCLTVCCYSAIEYDESRGICTVNEVLCKGCGNCAAACPSGAATHQQFTQIQIHREMMEVLR
ncbi:MAG: pyridine nucleotide-disulfide oxidoreductase [Nitrospira bacterium SM23_35]|nr:MAG: pyridine nucleotide-disulfide oxidoreductase [Nitrospira bacterium SM23_35]